MNIAIVTGASSGMGRELARLLARRQEVDKLILVARREDRLRDLSIEISCHAEARLLALDLADAGAASQLECVLKEENAKVAWLVNAAGFGQIGRFDELTVEEQLSMLDVNCRALTAITHTVLPYMKKGGHIVNLASAAGFLPQPRFAVYAATKSYVLSFSCALAEELRAKHIAVTAVCPGPVKTEFFDIAEKTGNIQIYKKIIMADCTRVSRGIIKAAAKGKTLYVPTLTMKAFRVLCKLPHRLLLRFVR